MKTFLGWFGLLFLILAFITGGITMLRLSKSSRCETRWHGMIDDDFRERAEEDLTSAVKSCELLSIDLLSPGGNAVDVIELSLRMEEARSEGLILEIRGRSFIASGATWIVGAGTPGHRFVVEDSFVLVHGIQVSSGYRGGECYVYKEFPSSEDERTTNRLYELVVKKYSDYSGKPIRETWDWLTCGNEQVGGGSLLVYLGLADHVVDATGKVKGE